MFDDKTHRTTGANKERHLKRVGYSLNEDDYGVPEDYEWDVMLEAIVSKAIEDIARASTASLEYQDAHNFIFSDRLDIWCIAFGRNMDTHLIRKKTKDIIMNENKRSEFLRHLHDKQAGKYRISRKDWGDNKVVSSDGVSGESDTELSMGDEDSGGEL